MSLLLCLDCCSGSAAAGGQRGWTPEGRGEEGGGEEGTLGFCSAFRPALEWRERGRRQLTVSATPGSMCLEWGDLAVAVPLNDAQV